MSTPHYFIAIPLPKPLKRHFSTWIEQLKGHLPYNQWTNQHDLHITLKFLGGVHQSQLNTLNQLLKSQSLSSVFSIRIGSLGTFGRTDQPRVLWADVEKTKELRILHQRIEKCALDAGFSKETRRYRPHITLAKKWNPSSAYGNLPQLNMQYEGDEQRMIVDEVVVYQIHPQKTPKYERVLTYALDRGEQLGPID